MNTPAIFLIQRFAGIDGLGAYLDGAKKTELSRTGNKFRLGAGLCERLELPRAPVWRSWVNDLDDCALTLPVLRRMPELREAVARRIWAMVPCPVCRADEALAALAGELRPTPKDLTGRVGCAECIGTGTQDARKLWERLRWEKVPESEVARMSVWLYLQSRNTMQKPVTVLNGGTWEIHGFRFEYDPTQKSGNTHARGYQNPRWTLASSVLSAPEAPPGTISHLHASEVLPGHSLPTYDELGRHVVVVLYDDPPYKGQHGKKNSTGYAHESDRTKMWKGARAWRDACAQVGIEFRYGLSEMECCKDEVMRELELPTNSAPVNTSRKSTFWAKDGGSEWLTTAKHYAPF